MASDYVMFQKVAMFLRVMIKQENQQHHGVLSSNISSVLARVYSILCLIGDIVVSQGHDLTHHIDDVTSEFEHHVTSTAVLFIGDYVMERDLEEIMRDRIQTYRNMTSHVSL